MFRNFDIAAVCELAKNSGAKFIADNIFASPVLQNTMKFGADIVVYSGTKHIDGQGRAMGGAVLSTEEFKEETLKPFLRHTGPCMSPFNAWVLLKGLETLKLRVKFGSIRICISVSKILNPSTTNRGSFLSFFRK